MLGFFGVLGHFGNLDFTFYSVTQILPKGLVFITKGFLSLLDQVFDSWSNPGLVILMYLHCATREVRVKRVE